jgi:hypothetical protein
MAGCGRRPGSADELAALGLDPGPRRPARSQDAGEGRHRSQTEPCLLTELYSLSDWCKTSIRSRAENWYPDHHDADRQRRDAMPAMFDLLEDESEPGVRAVLGHWLFGYLHPYPDGNGRLARFMMNALRVSGGYPWTVVRAEDRAAYLAAFDRASIDMDIAPFAQFIAERVRWSMERAA